MVKHHGLMSAPRKQPGSGAQGASLGNQEFLSQTNNNCDSVPEDNRFKYVDDLTTLEIIKLLSVGLQKYDFKSHVPSDVPIGGYFVNSVNLKSQEYLNKINTWTINHKMKKKHKENKGNDYKLYQEPPILNQDECQQCQY